MLTSLKVLSFSLIRKSPFEELLDESSSGSEIEEPESTKDSSKTATWTSTELPRGTANDFDDDNIDEVIKNDIGCNFIEMHYV